MGSAVWRGFHKGAALVDGGGVLAVNVLLAGFDGSTENV
jgi:hypothetical protein